MTARSSLWDILPRFAWQFKPRGKELLCFLGRAAVDGVVSLLQIMLAI